MTSRPTVLLTDYAWPDTAIEADLIESAGFRFVAGPAKAASANAITALAAEHQPAAIMTNWAPVSAAAIAATPPLRPRKNETCLFSKSFSEPRTAAKSKRALTERLAKSRLPSLGRNKWL